MFKNSIVKDTVVYWRKILEYLNESLSDSRNSLLLLAVLKSISKLNLATIDFIAKPVYKLAKSSIKQRNTSTEIEYELVNACLDFVTVYKPKSKNKIVSSVGKYSSRGFTVELKIKHEPIQDSFDYVAGIMEEIWKCENRLGSLIVEFIQNCPQNCYQHLLNCLEQAVSNNSSLIASSGALQSFQILVKVSNSQSKEFQSLISSKISIWISLFQDFVHESSSAVLILEAFTTVTTLIKSVVNSIN